MAELANPKANEKMRNRDRYELKRDFLEVAVFATYATVAALLIGLPNPVCLICLGTLASCLVGHWVL